MGNECCSETSDFMITIMKASAGSGKTWNLAKTYITLLLTAKDMFAYRHILAVTFTNKATDEMKSRIVEQLSILATDPCSSEYYGFFVPEVFKGPQELQKRAEAILCDILHDYSAFSVCTIDKFFQQVLRAFSRELGQYESYQLELDGDSLVTESVDRLLDSLSEQDNDVVEWLRDEALRQLSDKGYYSIESVLYNAAKTLHSVWFRELTEKNGIEVQTMCSKDNVQRLVKACDDYVRKYRQEVKSAASDLAGDFEKAGIALEQTLRGWAKCIGVYCTLEEKADIPQLSDANLKKLDGGVTPDISAWFKKSDAGNASVLAELPDFEKHRNALLGLMTDGYGIYTTAKQIVSRLFGFGIYRELQQNYSDLLKEKNVMCIDDSGSLLSSIIDGSDAPFIYEKTGTRYSSFLLDEFQDTSVVQWHNFLPLLQNSEAEAEPGERRNLIVGDVKQSIYRWRNSDWRLLDSEVEKSFHSVEMKTLDTNFRSEGRVVSFNNNFFEYIRNSDLGKRCFAEVGVDGKTVADIYSDVKQRCAQTVDGSPARGSVEVTFVSDKETVSNEILSTIEACKKAGASYGGIAILVRGNKEGETFAKMLMANGIPVISDDSLSINSSLAVRRLVSLLSHFANPADSTAGYLAESLNIEDFPEENLSSSIVDIAEHYLRALRKIDPVDFDSQSLYIYAFMDWMKDFVSINGNQLSEFLAAWNDANSPDGSVPKLSSPAAVDCVRVMTIHKSKGLDFQHVILPCFDKVIFFKSGDMWVCPDKVAEVDGNGQPDAVAADGSSDKGFLASKREFMGAISGNAFNVNISDKSANTAFDGAYQKESLMQLVDGLNIMYVAMTRAIKSNHIICSMPPESFRNPKDQNASVPKNAGQCLYSFLESNISVSGDSARSGDMSVFGVSKTVDANDSLKYRFGDLGGFAAHGTESGSESSNVTKQTNVPADYTSWKLTDKRARLRINADAADFFTEDQNRNRVRGVTLHSILSSVNSLSDLRGAVAAAVNSGTLSGDDAGEVYDLLEKRISSAVGRGWFSAEVAAGTASGKCGIASGVKTHGIHNVLNEREIISSSDGSFLRPDRVVINGEKVTIIDYKFGRRYDRYNKQVGRYAEQVSRYADLYKSMGYKDVEAYLWYVADDWVDRVV